MKKALILSLFVILLTNARARGATYFFVTFQYPPLAYENADHTPGGIFVDMLSGIMHRLGHQVRVEVLPWTRALDMVRQGEADAIFTAYKNRERETFLDYPEQVLFPQAVYFYKKQASPATFDGNLAALRQKRIGVVSTISYGNVFDNLKPGLSLEKASRLEHNFTKLILGRIDLLPSDNIVAENVIRQMGIGSQVTRIPVQVDSVPSYIAFSKKRGLTQLITGIDREIKQMKETGQYHAMLAGAGISLNKAARLLP